jgi:hypothetical protein
MKKLLDLVKKSVKDENWPVFVYGSVVGIFAGISIAVIILSIVLL